MWNSQLAVNYINSHAEPNSLGRCAAYVRRAVDAGGVTIKIPRPRIGNSASACDYGPSFVAVGFTPVFRYTGDGTTGTASITGQQTGDVVVIQPIAGHPHGHIALFNGSHWVSDFVQLRGFYPGPSYRNVKPDYILYRYGANEVAEETSQGESRPNKICYPIPKQSGQEFTRQEEILAHLEGESTGLYMIGRSGMWHGGIHITHETTPWCALSGKAVSEKIDFPTGYKGEYSVRCMADGEVVAYRLCRDYMQIPWEVGPLSCSGSFVLVRHYIQPGKTAKSGLHFYTVYMHLAPYSAYETEQEDNLWAVQDKLTAYDLEWVMVAGSENATVRNSYRKGTVPKDAIVEWDPADTNLHATAYNQRGYGLVTFISLSKEAQRKGENTTLSPGQQYWMLVDKKNIAPATKGMDQPSWWKKLLPPAKEVMEFDQVICPTPYAISAGDSVGHLGYFQAAKDGGYEARYQVHIECISMDDNLPEFLNNPENAGEKRPLWLKYSLGLELYKKDVKTGSFSKDDRTTSRSGILALNRVPSEADTSSNVEYWQLVPENGYVPKGKGGPEILSQYDLAKLGFKTEISEPTSFDYLNGNTQPVGLIRNVFQSLLNAAKDDTRISHALVPFNYQRLLNKIDSGASHYSPMEYLRALHNPSYRDVVQKTIVKHPSDWYHKKSDSIWQTFLSPLKKEAPEWKDYSEAFLDKMTWMQDITTEKLGPSLWHMHPVMFLGALVPDDDEMDLKWLKVPKGQLTFDVEGDDVENSLWFSRKVHWPGGVSGVTIGRGYDLGQQSRSNEDLSEIMIDEPLKSWLVGSQTLSAVQAKDRLNSASESIRKFQITRKQQYELFLVVYQRLEDDVKRISQKKDTIKTYHSNPDATAEQAWADIPDKIKEMLADLRYRGDYTPGMRRHIQRFAYAGDVVGFGKILSDVSYWPNVPSERFKRRVAYYENQ